MLTLRHAQPSFQRVLKAFGIICRAFETAEKVDAVDIPPLADDNPRVSQFLLDRLVSDVHKHLLFFNDVINVEAGCGLASSKATRA